MVEPGPYIGAVYESCRWRDDRRTRWRWKVVAEHPFGGEETWELARVGGKRTRGGNLFRTTTELRDPKKWALIAEESSPQEQLL